MKWRDVGRGLARFYDEDIRMSAVVISIVAFFAYGAKGINDYINGGAVVSAPAELTHNSEDAVRTRYHLNLKLIDENMDGHIDLVGYSSRADRTFVPAYVSKEFSAAYPHLDIIESNEELRNAIGTLERRMLQ